MSQLQYVRDVRGNNFFPWLWLFFQAYGTVAASQATSMVTTPVVLNPLQLGKRLSSLATNNANDPVERFLINN
jgi:hypothetical protein